MTPTAAPSSLGPALRGWLFAGLSGLALLLFLCFAAMWGRGFVVSSDHIWFTTAPRAVASERLISGIEIHSLRGLVQIQCLRAAVPGDADVSESGWHWTTMPRGPKGLVLGEDELVGGFGISAGRDVPATGMRLDFARVTLPWWFLVIITGLAPAAYLYSRLRLAYRIKHHLCVSCGYDLRATAERCPECGAAVVSATTLGGSILDKPAA